MAAKQLTYTVDANDCVSHVSKEWLEFAKENGARELTESNVIGKSLWNFISDTDTRQIYKELLEKVRTQSTTQKVEFRCDSPDVYRLMQIKIAPLSNDQLEFTTTTKEEKRRAPIELLRGKGGSDSDLITMCSWCKRVNLSGNWWELDEAVNQLDAFGDSPTPGVTHGICNDCKNELLAPASGSK